MKKIVKTIHQQKKLTFFFILLLSTCLVLVSILKVTLASEESHQTKSNDFTVANLESQVTEQFEKPITLTTNKDYVKQVKVKNNGNTAQFLRVLVLPELTGTNENTKYPLISSSKINKDIYFLDKTGQPIKDTAEWINGNDGYYYYTKALGKDQETVPLFEKVKLDNTVTNQLKPGEIKLDIVVKVEGIITDKDAFQKAWWQGKEPATEPLSKVNQLLLKEIALSHE